ncbi:MAG TPA: DUF6468 domain-containing protein [Xanthobacteraceae bacterium]|jgi:hypothetical protein|nr:DUF6468 domain-containing protein [Xanthobacteraceae bacterium]
MIANSYGLIIEGLVAVLLALTIGYCMLLNRRLTRLRNDEHSFKDTIAELITATESAERAIAGLKMTVRESEEILAKRLRDSELIATDLQRELKRGEGVLSRIIRITEAANDTRPQELEAAPVPMPAVPEPVLNAQALIRRRAAETVAAAQALANRARLRAGQAA